MSLVSFKNIVNRMCLEIIQGAYDKFPDFFRTGI